uniref:Uncharacterized protein n=1 Tax=Anguilla anguilla TaxID=7936 RepID=A0A0E9SAF1_ANGAN
MAGVDGVDGRRTTQPRVWQSSCFCTVRNMSSMPRLCRRKHDRHHCIWSQRGFTKMYKLLISMFVYSILSSVNCKKSQ